MGLRRMVRKVITDVVRWAQRYEDEGLVPTAKGWYGSNSIKAKTTGKSRHVVDPSSIGNENYGMHFTVYGATGGKVIQISSYDPHTDKNTAALHIITDKEDLGVELGMIITRESLSR